MTQGEVILLRLLSRRGYYGYELDKLIEDNQMRRWADIGFSSIYNLLLRLEKKELVTSRYEKVHGSPRRKIYEITEAGRKALLEEVRRLLKKPADIHDDFTVGMVVSDVLGEEEFDACLREYRDFLMKKREFYKNEMPESVKEKPRVKLAFERVRRLLEAEIKWLGDRG